MSFKQLLVVNSFWFVTIFLGLMSSLSYQDPGSAPDNVNSANSAAGSGSGSGAGSGGGYGSSYAGATGGGYGQGWYGQGAAAAAGGGGGGGYGQGGYGQNAGASSGSDSGASAAAAAAAAGAGGGGGYGQGGYGQGYGAGAGAGQGGYGQGYGAGASAASAAQSAVSNSVSRLLDFKTPSASSRVLSAVSSLVQNGQPDINNLPNVISNLSSQVSASNPGASGCEVLIQVLAEVVTALVHILSSASVGYIDTNSVSVSANTVGNALGNMGK